MCYFAQPRPHESFMSTSAHMQESDMFDNQGKVICDECESKMKVFRISQKQAVFECTACDHIHVIALWPLNRPIKAKALRKLTYPQ